MCGETGCQTSEDSKVWNLGKIPECGCGSEAEQVFGRCFRRVEALQGEF